MQRMNRPGRRPFISNDQKDFIAPRILKDQTLFIETNYSGDHIKRLAGEILELFGYSPDVLKIETTS